MISVSPNPINLNTFWNSNIFFKVFFTRVLKAGLMAPSPNSINSYTFKNSIVFFKGSFTQLPKTRLGVSKSTLIQPCSRTLLA